MEVANEAYLCQSSALVLRAPGIHLKRHRPGLKGRSGPGGAKAGDFALKKPRRSRRSGVTASRDGHCDQVAGSALAEGGISGVLAGPSIRMAAGVSQGCTAAGPVRTITAGGRNIIIELDGTPPLDALFQDLNLEGADGIDALYAALENLHVALKVPNCDTGDYLVRNLAGIDTESGVIAIGDRVEPGQKLFFARRDREAAAHDLRAMARKVLSRVTKANGALYVSCCGRGPHLFSSAEQEIGLVQDILGDVPLAGFYANGEIAGDRIYGYTGVLTIF